MLANDLALHLPRVCRDEHDAPMTKQLASKLQAFRPPQTRATTEQRCWSTSQRTCGNTAVHDWTGADSCSSRAASGSFRAKFWNLASAYGHGDSGQQQQHLPLGAAVINTTTTTPPQQHHSRFECQTQCPGIKQHTPARRLGASSHIPFSPSRTVFGFRLRGVF